VPEQQAHRQLDLFDALLGGREARVVAARRVADAISDVLGERVRLTVHDNRSTMVSFRRTGGALHYRVHHMFLEAPGEVVRALAAFAGPARGGAARRRTAGGHIDAFVRSRRDRIGAPKVGRLQPRGRAHDLQAIFDRLNAAEFGGAIEARIGWGAVRPGRRRRTVKTGVYLQDARIIRIHPTLDRPEVPEFYVAAVVFHEMLHQAVPVHEAGGRRVVHGREFRARERAYRDHERARAWESRHLGLLLSSPDR
jgi:predicted SprT family Zn-dependent metalloprotease